MTFDRLICVAFTLTSVAIFDILDRFHQIRLTSVQAAPRFSEELGLKNV